MGYNDLWIKDAIRGGYVREKRSISIMLWDIRAWEAVGRTRNWTHTLNNGSLRPSWRSKMNNFYFNMQRGETIEDALGAITDVV